MTVFRRVLGLLLPIIIGWAAAAWTPLTVWIDMKEGLIAFLGFLAASLVQVMPLTANFIQADKLEVSQAQRLTQSLTRQQHYWIGLLSATISALVVVIVVAAVSKSLDGKVVFDRWVCITAFQLLCFLEVSLLVFVIIKMFGLFGGMMSLHRLRGELVVDAAMKAAAARQREIQASVAPVQKLVPDGYGAIVQPPPK